MSSRIDDLRMVDPVLTTIAQGYSNASLVGEYLFPNVTVSKLKGKVPVFGRESFVVRDTNRATRALSNRIPPSDLNFVDFETTERDIELAIDYIEEEEAMDYDRYEQKICKDLRDILLLGKEKEIADYVQNAANYDSDHKHEIASNVAWDNYSNTADPILVLRGCMASFRTIISRYPNTMIIGDSTYQKLVLHPKVLEKIKYTGLGKMSMDNLKELLDIPNIYVGMSVSSVNGVDFTDVWKDNIILAYVDGNSKESRSEYNPSFGYTFSREGKPEIDTYKENGGKIKVIRCTDNYCFKVCAADAGFLIYNTNHSS